MSPRLLRSVLVVGLALASTPLFAQGGPPLVTDDPDTPGPHHWEINISYIRQKFMEARTSDEPRLDLNYGVGRRIQLKLEGPWVSQRTADGQTAHGLGDIEAGVKYRFLGEEGQRIAWAVYPQYEFHPSQGAVDRGLTEPGHAFFLPTEMTFELTHFELNVEIGREFGSGRPSGWTYGLATEVGVGHKLELVGELHGEKEDGEPTELILNGGGRFKVTRQVTFMLAVGHAVVGPEQSRRHLLVYAGLQLNLPDTFDFTRPPRRADRATGGR